MTESRTLRTSNGLVATEPFPFTGAVTQVRSSGLMQIQNLQGLVGLTVLVHGPDGLRPGDKVFVPGRDVKAPYGTSKHLLPDGREAILVPATAVVMVEVQS
jgi:hypothetical protein